MKIKVRELSLASYMKMKGNDLLTYKDGLFIFDSELPLGEWKLKFLKSESHKFDNEVRELRWFLNNG